MATIIYIDHDEPEDAVQRVRDALNEVADHDVNWNGADFRVERDDYTWIKTKNEIAGAQLLGAVYSALEGDADN